MRYGLADALFNEFDGLTDSLFDEFDVITLVKLIDRKDSSRYMLTICYGRRVNTIQN